jgi:hypothetical protein
MKNKNSFLLLIGIFFAALLSAYWTHFANPFQFDDDHTIVENVYIRKLANIPQFFKDAKTFSTLPSNQSYRPVVTTSLAIDYQLSGGADRQGKIPTFFFHCSMFVLYVALLVLLFFFFRRLLLFSIAGEQASWTALIATAWFGLHTANAETLNYIISRSDSYSTLFVVCGLFLYALYPKLRATFIYLLPVALGMLTKESALVFPALLFLYCCLFEEKTAGNFKRSFLACLPSLVLCAGLLCLSMWMAEGWQPGGSSRWSYIITQPLSVAHYLTMFVLPLKLCADTDAELLPSIIDARFVAPLFLHAMLIFWALKFSRQKSLRPISFGILWFYIALIPTSSVIPLSEVRNDHRMFFPFIGLSLAAVVFLRGLILKHLWNNSAWRVLCVVLITAAFAAHIVGIRKRNKVWSSGENLWLEVTEKAPRNGRGLMNYGVVQMAKGNYKVAEKYFLDGLAIWPRYSVLHINLGILYGALGKKDDAERYFKLGIQLATNNPQAYYFYARWLYEQGRLKEATEQAEHAIRITPSYLDALMILYKSYRDDKNAEGQKRIGEQIKAISPWTVIS